MKDNIIFSRLKYVMTYTSADDVPQGDPLRSPVI